MPDGHAFGADSFAYRANDCPFDIMRDTQDATIAVTIQPVYDPPITLDGQMSVPVGNSSVAELQVVNWDMSTLTYTFVSLPTAGAVYVANNTATATASGQVWRGWRQTLGTRYSELFAYWFPSVCL